MLENTPVNLVKPNDYAKFLFKFTIPTTSSTTLEGIIAFNRVTDKILSYLEKKINTSYVDLQSVTQDVFVGTVIETSIYDMFTELEDIDYDPHPNTNYTDINDYVLTYGSEFRYELYVFAREILVNCVSELNKIRATTNLLGKPIETYTLTRSKLDPTTLEVSGYLEKII